MCLRCLLSFEKRSSILTSKQCAWDLFCIIKRQCISYPLHNLWRRHPVRIIGFEVRIEHSALHVNMANILRFRCNICVATFIRYLKILHNFVNNYFVWYKCCWNTLKPPISEIWWNIKFRDFRFIKACNLMYYTA